MKNVKMFVIAIVAITVSSCSKDDIKKLSVSDAIADVTGNWKVTYYFDNSDGSTDDFAGYTFNFNADGVLTAVSGSETFTGTWTVESSDDDPDFDKELKITIAGNDVMDELSHSWLLTELTDSTMQLKDDSGSEELHFEKI